MGKTIKTQIVLDGEREYKNALKDIKAETKLLNSELKLSRTIYADNAKSADALKEKQEILTKKLSEQTKVVALADKHMEMLKKEYGENSKEAHDFEISLNTQKIALAEIENELKSTVDGLEDLADASDETSDGLKNTGDSTDTASTKFGKMASVVTKSAEVMAKSMAVVATAVGGAIIAFGKVALDSAKELEGTQAKYETVFAGMTDASDQFIADFQKLTPATKAEARSMASGIQDILVPMGLARDEATALTGETMHLVGALTNFNSSTTNAQEVSEKFQSALTGEYSSLKSLGIQVDAQMVKDRARADGVTEAEALMSLAYEQSGDALNAYNIENEDTITKQEKLKASMEDLSAEVGLGMLPAYNNVLDVITNLAGEVIPFFAEAMEGLTGLFTNQEGASELFANGVEGLVNKISENIPAFLEKGTEIVSALITGVASAMPSLISGFSEILPIIVGALVGLLPLLLDVGSQVMLELALGISSAIPEIIPTLVEVATSMIDVLVEQIPLFIETGIKVLTSLVEEAPTIIDNIVAILPDLIESIVVGLLDSIPQIVDAGIKLFVALVENAPYIIEQIVLVIPKILSKVISAIISSMPQIKESGIKLFSALVDGFPTFAKSILAIIPKLINSIKDGFKNQLHKMVSIGSDIVRGIWEGISNMVGWITGKVKDFLGGIVTSAKGILGIQSPSKVFENEVGLQIVAGLVAGIDKNKDKAKLSAEKMAKETYESTIDGLKEVKISAEKEINDINNELLKLNGIDINSDSENISILDNQNIIENFEAISEITTNTFDYISEYFTNMQNKFYNNGKNMFTSLRKGIEEELSKILIYVQSEMQKMSEMLDFNGVSSASNNLSSAYQNVTTNNVNNTNSNSRTITNNITYSTPLTIGTFNNSSSNDIRQLSRFLQEENNKQVFAKGGNIFAT